MNICKRLKRVLFALLRKSVAPTVTVAGMSVTANADGVTATVSITGITVSGAAAPDGTSVSVPVQNPDTTAGAAVTGVTAGGAFSGTWTIGALPGTYAFGPADIDSETVPAAVATFTRSKRLIQDQPVETLVVTNQITYWGQPMMG